MDHLDSKQSKIIASWIELAERRETDSYLSFISMWIAFNAFCCARFGRDANRLLPQLRHEERLRAIAGGEVPTSGTIRFADEKYRVRLNHPERIDFVVSERYAEHLVFECFARQYRDAFEEYAKADPLRSELDSLLAAIRKPDGHNYVVNMAKVPSYHNTVGDKDCLNEGDVKEMHNRNVVVAVFDRSDLVQIKALLYQVRCNIFHGEKAPGIHNDDQIASAAYPVLRRIVKDVAEISHVRA